MLGALWQWRALDRRATVTSFVDHVVYKYYGKGYTQPQRPSAARRDLVQMSGRLTWGRGPTGGATSADGESDMAASAVERRCLVG